MRTVTYAGGTVVTTDRIASTLVQLTAALARRGLAEAVRIPVFAADGRPRGDADLVVGVGVEVLSVSATWSAADPACDEETAALDRALQRAGAGVAGLPVAAHYDRMLDDPEFDDLGALDRPSAPIRLRPRIRPGDRR